MIGKNKLIQKIIVLMLNSFPAEMSFFRLIVQLSLTRKSCLLAVLVLHSHGIFWPSWFFVAAVVLFYGFTVLGSHSGP